eukprot:9434646-Karenia_brevis.AAC.1
MKDPNKFLKICTDICHAKHANRVVAVAGSRVAIAADCVFECPSCRRAFKTKQALSVHKFRAHGVRPNIWQRLDTTY